MKIDFKNSSTVKTIVLFTVILFSNQFIYTQISPDMHVVLSKNYIYEVIIDLKIHKKICLEDSLVISLTSFSHKHPFTGGASKTTAYLSLSKDSISQEMALSVNGIEGRMDSLSYDVFRWREYDFRLKSLNYDNSIEIIIIKKK